MDPSALASGRATFSLDLPPAAAGGGAAAALAGARAALARRRLRWNPDLGGVLLGVTGESLVEGVAPIGEVFPLVRVRVAAEVTVFKPRPGMVLSGVINKIGADHVGILTLGAINAAVGADRVRAAFSPPAPRGSSANGGGSSGGGGGAAWVHAADPAHTLAVGTPVLYECVRVRADGGGFATIVGSLEAGHTGVEGRVPPPRARWAPPPAARAPGAGGGGGGGPAAGAKANKKAPGGVKDGGVKKGKKGGGGSAGKKRKK